MTPLLPSPASCHPTTLPKLDADQESSLSECEKRAKTLECRTGASTVLARSSVFVYGGFTVPLNLTEVNSVSIQQELILFFARKRKHTSGFQNLAEWISQEVFHLDLISRKWDRVETQVNQSNDTNGVEDDSMQVTMRERVFHSMCYHDGHLYVFGGLVVSPQSGYELIASNELWALGLRTKVWRLISCNPCIARRFNHNMHIVQGPEDEDDTHLYVVGGLNNLDRPIHVVDIYNLTQNRWESLDDESSVAQVITTNIDGQNTPLLENSNFSLLIRDQATNKPLIVSYAPSETEEDANPVVIQPLNPGPNGKRMPAFRRRGSRDAKQYKAPFHLQHPSGDYFGHNIIISGFYPDFEPSSFHCFTYNIPTGKWTEISTISDDPSGSSHRLWQLFVWQSHHRIVLLGTMTKENHLPSVQKFSNIMCVALPMINVFHRAPHLALGRERSAASLDQSSLGHDSFEGYSRYSAPQLEITTIAPVFPSYAMALGKDFLELCGQQLSDFEIVTEDGDSVRVPIFLLRKRWGRYFDDVLAHGYVKASKEFENQNRDNVLTKFSSSTGNYSVTPTSHQFDTTSSKGPENLSPKEELDLTVPLDEQSEGSQSLYPSVPRKSSPLIFANKSSTPELSRKPGLKDKSNTGTVVLPKMHHSKSDSSANLVARNHEEALKDTGDNTDKSNIDPSKTTSSSGGMVFRLPFQEGSGGSAVPLPLLQALNNDPSKLETLEKHLGPASRRKSSVSTSFVFDGGPRGARRASHPNFHNPDEKMAASQSPLGSRKASVASQNSSISFVSSSSDRMGNPNNRRTSQDSTMSSSTFNSLNSQLPPPQPMPTDPLPSTPHQPSIDVTMSSASAKNSPFSSRRSSYYHDVLRPGLSSSISQSLLGINEAAASENSPLHPPDPYLARKRSIDRQLLEDNLIDVELEASIDPHQSSSSTTERKSVGQKGAVKARMESEGSRPSYLSLADSSTSINFTTEQDLEPLLVPRSLYMPWPTSTIKSLIEFFYTGQVNGRWLLSPVALNLLVMAKVYEITLLYDLLAEAFYSILGKKEESLLAIGESLKRFLYLKNTKGYVDSPDLQLAFQELLELEKSLHAVDDGFFDVQLLKRATRATSACSSESGDIGAINKNSKEQDSLNVPVLFAGGPRGSHNSIGSSGTPNASAEETMKFTSPKENQAAKKNGRSRSATLKELGGLDKESGSRDFTDYTANDVMTQEASDKTDRENRADRMEQQKLSNMSQNVNSDFSTQIIDLKSSEGREDSQKEGRKTPDRTNVAKEMDRKHTKAENEKIDTAAEEKVVGNADRDENRENEGFPENSTSSSDSDDMCTGFGLASTTKIDKKLRQREDDISVDPLSKKIDSENSSLKNIIDFYKKGDHLNRPDAHKTSVDNLTLANMASTNSLPPVDYVVELIHETATLVHDTRLIVRCVSVITLSKNLKLLKKKLESYPFMRDSDAGRSATPTENAFTGSNESAKVDDNATTTGSPSIEQLPRVESSASLDRRSPMTSNTTTGENRAGTAPESGPKPTTSETSLPEKSDVSSIDTKSSKAPRSQRIKKVNSNLAGTGLTGAALFMTGSFGPPIPKVKTDKTGASSTSSPTSRTGKSFFGKRK
ncbi:LAFA_0D11958g1_1 [Lachancea sp. 'fantastica']|nr:LAFA_0D11958g1_1 [Lachancea sp. 'fantastica']